jgi:putative addiction module CopG family antidote
MSVTLTPRTEERIKRLVESGRYPDADSVVDDALEALETRTRTRFKSTRELILAGLHSGEGIVMTDEEWAKIELEADEADHLGLPIRDEVQP